MTLWCDLQPPPINRIADESIRRTLQVRRLKIPRKGASGQYREMSAPCETGVDSWTW